MLNICIEGTNGSGKTYTINKLLERLSPGFKRKLTSGYIMGQNVYHQVVPGDGVTGIRDIMKSSDNDFDHLTYLHLTVADQLELSKTINQFRNTNLILISDRGLPSIFGCQGALGGIDFRLIDMLTANFFTYPDLYFFLDITKETSLRRRKDETIKDRWEKEADVDKFDIIKSGYDHFAKLNSNVKVIDANADDDYAINTIESIIKHEFEKSMEGVCD